jgi:hypothetical protein
MTTTLIADRAQLQRRLSLQRLPELEHLRMFELFTYVTAAKFSTM